MKAWTNLQFRVEPELVAEMDRQAAALGISRTELLRRLVYGGQHTGKEKGGKTK